MDNPHSLSWTQFEIFVLQRSDSIVSSFVGCHRRASPLPHPSFISRVPWMSRTIVFLTRSSLTNHSILDLREFHLQLRIGNVTLHDVSLRLWRRLRLCKSMSKLRFWRSMTISRMHGDIRAGDKAKLPLQNPRYIFHFRVFPRPTPLVHASSSSLGWLEIWTKITYLVLKQYAMPRYCFDYCDTYLTQDSAACNMYSTNNGSTEISCQTERCEPSILCQNLGENGMEKKSTGLGLEAISAAILFFLSGDGTAVAAVMLTGDGEGGSSGANSGDVPQVRFRRRQALQIKKSSDGSATEIGRNPATENPKTSVLFVYSGYGAAPNMLSMMGPPGASSIPMQIPGLPHPPMMNPRAPACKGQHFWLEPLLRQFLRIVLDLLKLQTSSQKPSVT
ncbi:hypothetical protein MRB53_017173 [Persea americana]|uniref:Uncharacterized protein n=1 Tax=Persea americana TaxID=3435 RepID=A0ACC2M494_PERAE|nr:hypothetical protein MRB53_017173 [Persea americana]